MSKIAGHWCIKLTTDMRSRGQISTEIMSGKFEGSGE